MGLKVQAAQPCPVKSNSLGSHGLYSPWNSPGQNTEVESLSLLQGIFPAQRSNPGLPHCRWILYQLSHRGSPRMGLGLLYLKQITNKDLLYSTWDSTQCLWQPGWEQSLGEKGYMYLYG